MRHRRWLPAAFAIFAVLLAACGSSSSGGSGSGASPVSSSRPSSSSQPPSAATAMLKSAKTSLGTILTDSKGFSLYWFAIDTPASSKCTGGCTTYWPPVTGAAQAASGVTLPGKLGTITRSDGSVQATYNGHPLYTYAGDKSPGQTNGNNVNGFGGVWHAATISASAGRPSSSPSSGASSPSSGGGYGGGGSGGGGY
jgi:predicted lipoprotein with Yx(FWY)xxD motif